MDLKELLKVTISRNASDLHLTENSPPVLRVDGKLMLIDHRVLVRDELKKSIYGMLTDAQKEKFERDRELDFSLALEGLERFRVNVHIQKGSVEAAFRRIPLFVPSIEDLALPPVIADFARRPDGLVLITGPTGSGKTTTLAAMIDLINRERSCMVIAIEDPIEYVHRNKKAVIKQREVYSDTLSFAEALKRCLRQDPDVIIVGEMRDLETISTTLTAAETGHLVLATLHTPDAAQTIERIIDVFPAHQQQQVRLQLSACLQGVVCQRLLPRAEGEGRILATEILVATSAVRNLIREKMVEQIPTAIQTGSQYGMHTMDACLRDLFEQGLITFEDAMTQVKNVEEFQHMLERKHPKKH
ncbi:MAG: type IV pilus twitching motility protein PilT [Candidatus Omnitrophica bacterium]|nr:type IV pilus twitching motility protein PilT [Candidatus Omnitrophota bacterium]